LITPVNVLVKPLRERRAVCYKPAMTRTKLVQAIQQQRHAVAVFACACSTT